MCAIPVSGALVDTIRIALVGSMTREPLVIVIHGYRKPIKYVIKSVPLKGHNWGAVKEF